MIELFPVIFLLALVYAAVGFAVYSLNHEAWRLYDRRERQVLLGYAIWWLPIAIYILIKSLIQLVIWMTKGFFNATFQMLKDEFVR